MKKLKKALLIHPEELTENMLSMLREAEIEVLGLHPVGGMSAADSLERLIALHNNSDYLNMLDRARGLGIEIEYEMHALSWLLPRSEYENHPDWFRQNEEGKRTADFNMCVSNDTALAYISERAAKLASLLKSDTGKYYFWIDDVAEKACSCDKCRNLTPSDQALLIYNAMIRGIRSVESDAKLAYLAYFKTTETPTSVKPEEGIFLEFAPFDRDTKLPLDTADSAENRKNLALIKPLLAYFGEKDSKVLDYWIDNSLFSGWAKPPKKLEINRKAIRSDIKLYNALGFKEVTSFACFLSDDYIALYGEPPIKEYSECFD